MLFCTYYAKNYAGIMLEDTRLITGLCSHHWLMTCDLRDEVITVLKKFKPGSVLQDSNGHLWYRRAKMVCTRHRFS